MFHTCGHVCKSAKSTLTAVSVLLRGHCSEKEECCQYFGMQVVLLGGIGKGATLDIASR